MDFSSLGLGELDWVFVVIILLSTLLGVSRGMVREIFALVGWVAAFFVLFTVLPIWQRSFRSRPTWAS